MSFLITIHNWNSLFDYVGLMSASSPTFFEEMADDHLLISTKLLPLVICMLPDRVENKIVKVNDERIFVEFKWFLCLCKMTRLTLEFEWLSLIQEYLERGLQRASKAAIYDERILV